MEKNKMRLVQGNEACVMGALYAGMRFYAGYPITPSSEIAEESSIQLPKVGGKFIQMEDEIASMAAAIGASLAGKKAMTATSGPGFSLKQENIGFACMAEVPVVIVNVMRMGPSTGLPTSPAQGDIMQARWGTHGDHPIIVITPTSVKEMYEFTIRAFNLAEKYRTPVILLADEVIAHMREGVEIRTDIEVIDRAKPTPGEPYLPYQLKEGDIVPPLASFGDGYRFHVTGLSHGENGFPTNSVEINNALIRRLNSKITDHLDDIVEVEEGYTSDAEFLILSIGSTARAAKSVVNTLREQGIKIGYFIPKTVWPFPEKELKECFKTVKKVIVPEMNMGQIALEVERVAAGQAEVHRLNKVTGELFTVAEINDGVMAVINK